MSLASGPSSTRHTTGRLLSALFISLTHTPWFLFLFPQVVVFLLFGFHSSGESYVGQEGKGVHDTMPRTKLSQLREIPEN